jgi:hypothetical protein
VLGPPKATSHAHFQQRSLSRGRQTFENGALRSHPTSKMHSTLVRLQNVFGFFTTVAFTVASIIALSSFVSPQNPTASISLRNVQVVRGRPHYYSPKREEYAHVKFDLDAGMSLTQVATMPRPSIEPAELTLRCRPQLPLQLEHEASLCLPQGRLPLHPRPGTPLGSHHLGCHPRVELRALEPKPLRSSRPQVQAAQAIRQETRCLEAKDHVALPRWRTPP